jgi:dTDP-4-amino-4,6-dideoxygalactose transaminase
MGPITDIARRCGLLVLEDAAQAHGARYLGRRLGTFGDAAAWSFYPTKNLGAFGDAGAVTTDDGELAGRLRALRHPRAEGSDRSRVAACSSRLDEIQAAILGAKLTFLDDWNNRRRRIAARYRGALADVEATMPAVAPWAEPVWHAFVVRSRARDRLQRHLATAGVATAVHYPKPPAEHACFSMPNDGNEGANRLAKEVLSLPIGPELDDDQLEHVVASMCAFDA